MRKISSFGDPKLYAVSVLAEHLSKSAQPLVPQQVFMGGGGGNGDGPAAGMGMLGTLINLLVAEKAGFTLPGNLKSPPEVAASERDVKPAGSNSPRLPAGDGARPVTKA